MLEWQRFLPAGVLGVGCALLLSVQAQRSMELLQPLDRVPDPIEGLRRENIAVPDDQIAVARMTSYTNRVYYTDTLPTYAMYVGWYDSQSQGKTAHSPKNCLPGAGWEAMDSRMITLTTPGGETATVNRYLMAKGNAQALVYYWYQGRGRVAASEYAVKWDLLRDAALKRRTDEALVRIVVPVIPSSAAALASPTEMQAAQARAEEVAQAASVELIDSLEEFLPG